MKTSLINILSKVLRRLTTKDDPAVETDVKCSELSKAVKHEKEHVTIKYISIQVYGSNNVISMKTKQFTQNMSNCNESH